MEEKRLLEVTFEWIRECGAFEQLRRQCEIYVVDVSVRSELSYPLYPFFMRRDAYEMFGII